MHTSPQASMKVNAAFAFQAHPVRGEAGSDRVERRLYTLLQPVLILLTDQCEDQAHAFAHDLTVYLRLLTDMGLFCQWETDSTGHRYRCTLAV